MKALLPLLVALTAIAQTPPAAPQNRRLVSASVDDGIIPLIVVSSNGLFLAYWYSPPYIERTNASIYIQPVATQWLPEVSMDGLNWIQTSELIYLPPRAMRPLRQPCYDCLHLAQAPSLSAQVRIRRVSY